MLARLFLAAIIVATQTAALVAGPIRGRSFDLTTQIVQISDGSDVTSGTVTVKVSKDGGAQATATNAATHLGGGQWKVTLTPAEMDAASVGVQIAESGSYTTNHTILTEQPLPFSRWVARYDGSLGGNLLTTFSRNATTVDGVGTAVAANVPRFLQSDRSVASLLNFQATGVTLVNTSILVGGGYDLDGDSILVATDTGAANIKFIEVKPDGSAALLSTTAATALPGAGGGTTYRIRGARVIYGTTIVHAERTVSSVIEGMTLFITQDNGATWSRVENSSTDGGGFNVPKATAYGSNADTIQRGREWSTSIFPEGGIDADGNFNPNDIWFTWTDYLQAGGATPKGWQCGIVRLTRDSTAEHFTVGKSRILDERWEASAAANCHGHSVALTGNGLFILANGDVEKLHALHTYQIDHDSYETAAITETNDWFGEVAPAATNGRSCPQISMMMPGRNGVVLGSNDTWQSPVLQINNATTSAEECDISSPLTIQADSNGGAFYRGWGNIWAQWNPGLNGRGGEYAVGGLNATPDVMRHYSEDGIHWASLNNTDGWEQGHVLCGDYIAVVRSSDEVLMLAKKPKVQTVNPLMLAPGADNLLTSAAPDNGAATSGGNTRSLVNWTNGKFVFASGGADVPNAPKVPAPFPNPIYVYLGCESTTSNAHGSIYAQASGQTWTTGTNYLAGTFAFAPLGTKAIGRATVRVGTAGATNDSTAELGPMMDRSKGHWTKFSLCDNPINDPAAARGTVTLVAGPLASTANDECPMLVAIGGVYLAQLITPYPCTRLSTSNPNEYAQVVLPQTYSNAWTASGTVIRSEEGATVTNAMPSGTLATIWKDASNYVAIYYDGPNYEVEVTATVAGVAGSTQTIAIEDWPRDFGLSFCVSDDGTDILVSLLTPRNGVQTATCSGGSLKGPPTRLRWSDAAQTSVYNYYVAGCEFQDRAMTLSQQADQLATLDFLSTDDQLAAEAAQEQLNEQLAGIPYGVWREGVSGVTGTTGKTLGDVLADTTEIGVAGAGLTAINLPDQTMNITGNVTGNVSGSVGSVTGAVGSVTGNVGGNVVGSTGSISGVTFPANFASLAVDGSGRMQVQYGTSTGQINATAGNVGANVLFFGGSAGSFTAGIPSVRATQLEDGLITAAKIGADAITDAKVAGDVTIASVTGNVGGVAGTINTFDELGATGNPNVLLVSEIDTVGSQTSFTLVDGATFNDAYNGQAIVLYDDSNSDYPSVRVVSDYVGSTKTVTLDSAPDFTLGTDDSVRVFATAPGTAAPTVAQIRNEMDANSTKLANLDVLLSSRLATAGYTEPPTTGQITSAIEALASYISMGANASTAATQSTAAATSAATAASQSTTAATQATNAASQATTAATQATAAATSSAAVQGKLPSSGAKMAGEGAIAKNLDQVDGGGGGGGGTSQPRVNRPPAERFTFDINSRSDGGYKARGKLRLRVGEVSAGNIAFGVRMDELYGSELVKEVGTPVVSDGLPGLTATGLGPHSTIAVVQVGGTAESGQAGTIEFPVTMDVGGDGEIVFVTIDVEILP